MTWNSGFCGGCDIHWVIHKEFPLHLKFSLLPLCSVGSAVGRRSARINTLLNINVPPPRKFNKTRFNCARIVKEIQLLPLRTTIWNAAYSAPQSAIQTWRGWFASNNLNIYAQLYNSSLIALSTFKAEFIRENEDGKSAARFNHIPIDTGRRMETFHRIRSIITKSILIVSINQLEN